MTTKKVIMLEELMNYMEDEEKRLANLAEKFSLEGNKHAERRCTNGIRQMQIIKCWVDSHSLSVEVKKGNEAIMPWLLYRVELCEEIERDWIRKRLKYVSDIDGSFSMGLHSGREEMCSQIRNMLMGVAEFEY